MKNHFISLFVLSLILITPTANVLVAMEMPEEEMEMSEVMEMSEEMAMPEGDDAAEEPEGEADQDEAEPEVAEADVAAAAEEEEAEEAEEEEAEPAEEAEAAQVSAAQVSAARVSLDQEGTFAITGDASEKKRLFQEGTSVNKKIRAAIDDVEDATSELHKFKDILDVELDAFHDAINPLLGNLQQTIEDILSYLGKYKALSPELIKLKAQVDGVLEKGNHLRLLVEQIATKKQGLLEQLTNADEQRSNVSALGLQAEKEKQKILGAADTSVAQQHRNTIIEIHGRALAIKKLTVNTKKEFGTKIAAIKKNVAAAIKAGQDLIKQGTNFETQIVKIGDKEAQQAVTEEIALLERIRKERETKKERLEAVSLAHLQWWCCDVVVPRTCRPLQEFFVSLFLLAGQER